MNVSDEPSIKGVIFWLKVHGKKIGQECEAGDKDASAVIGQYQLIKSKPWNHGDPVLWAFLYVAIEKYCKSHKILPPLPIGLGQQ